MQLNLRQRGRAALVHLAISAAIAVLAGGVVFLMWYPGAYRQLSGGRELFLLIVTVDVVLGPFLTFAVFDLTHKTWLHLRRDLAVIVLVQGAALVYGLHTVYAARPVALIFEVDRLRVIAASEVYLPELSQARPEYRRLPLTGPWLLSARPTEGAVEKSEALELGLRGFDTGARPRFWRPYAEARARIDSRAQAVSRLLESRTQQRDRLTAEIVRVGLNPSTARYLPVVARGDWIAVLDPQSGVAAFVAVDGFL